MSRAALVMTGPLDQGLSGGDLHGLRLLAHWRVATGESATIVTVPAIAAALDESASAIILRSRLDGRLGSMPVYLAALLVRTIAAMRAMPHAEIAVATSHFFHDVVPVVAHSRRHGSVSCCYVYHLVGESGRRRSARSLVSASLERISLAILRRRGDVVFVDNDETETALLSRGFRSDQLRRTENAYDPPKEVPPRRESETPIVLYCGRLAASKGVGDLPTIAERLARESPEARLVVAGDGPMRGELETAARALPNLELLGFVSEEEKWRLLTEATVFVSPSREEGWGIAVGEALLAGTPALVLDLPAYAHFGDLVTRAASPAELCDIVVDHVRRPDLTAAKRDALARRRDELPTWASVLDREIAILTSAIV